MSNEHIYETTVRQTLQASAASELERLSLRHLLGDDEGDCARVRAWEQINDRALGHPTRFRW